MKPKVLFVHHGRGIGGAPTSMSLIANRMHQDGHDVYLLFLKSSDAVSLFDSEIPRIELKIPLKYFNHSSRWYRWYEFPVALLQIVSWLVTVFILAPYYLIRIKPDVVYLNSSVLTDWAVACKVLSIRNVLHVREAIAKGYFGLRRRFIRLTLTLCCSDIIFLSNHNLSLVGLKRDRIHVIPNYCHMRHLKPEEKIYDFVFVGGEKPIKGITYIEELLATGLDYKICLLGYYSDSFIHKYSSDQRCEILGVVSDATKYISKGRFLLFPATTPHFPRPVIEGYSVGAIPIASELPGIDEVIIEGQTGLLFSIAIKHDFLKKVEQALGMPPNILDAFVKEGSSLYNNKFSEANELEIINIIVASNEKC